MTVSGSVKKALIVGGGIIGSSIAWHMATAGVKVTLLEARSAAAGASSNSFGWINATAAESADYFALRMQAITDYKQMLQRQPKDSEARRCTRFAGSLWWETQGSELTELGARLHNYGHCVREIGSDEFSKLEPNVANPPESCLYTELDGAAEGDTLTRFFLQQAASKGATVLLGASLNNLLTANGCVCGVQSSHGKYEADVVILATGAATQTIAESVGVNLPMENRRGLIVHTNPVPDVISQVINADDIHFRQAPDGHIVMGEIFSGGTFSAKPHDTPAGFSRELLRRLRKRLPGVENLRIERVQLGTRPVPLDGYPAVGMPASLPGLYVVTTHSGITLAPLLGRLVTEELVECRRSVLLSTYHPDRFM